MVQAIVSFEGNRRPSERYLSQWTAVGTRLLLFYKILALWCECIENNVTQRY